MGEQPRDEAGPSGSGSTKGKRELARVAKWERMMVKKRMDQGGNVVAWDWAAGKGAKVRPLALQTSQNLLETGS